jgi:type I restriction enzyme M protein
VKTTLGEVNVPSRARALPSEAPGLPYVGMEHVEAQTMKLLGQGQASDLRSSSVRFSKGDVLYGKMRPYLNKVWLAEFDGLCSAEFLVFPKTEGLISQLFAYRLNSQDFVNFANHQVSGDRPRVDFEKLANFSYLLAPTREQERIVAMLDALLSRVAAGEAAARRALERLKRYHAAVLHAAVTGELTRDWRKTNPPHKFGALILTNLLVERRACWELAELKRLHAAGKAQNKITDPAKLERLISMMETENWAGLDMDVKGEIYEGLLARNAEDVRGGAGQYFTPRPIIRAIVQVMRPEPTMRIADPACGTGGFLLAAYEYLVKSNPSLDRKTQRFLNERALHGTDIVPSVTRLCAMNLYLHGLGGSENPIVETADSLAKKPAVVDMVLTNPPFGKKSSITVINDEGKRETETIYYERQDFWATTSNKQLNFVQNVYSMLTEKGTAAVVVPDNVLFEAGAGEKIRRALLDRCDVHTLLRLPTGIWYSPGVKANVLFFDKKPAAKTPWTKDLWVYDLRTNRNFTLRQNPIADEDLKEFVQCYQTAKPSKRQESERFKRFSYAELMARDKANLDLFWLKDDTLADTDNLPKPAVLAAEIIEDLEEALEEFRAVEEELEK